MKDNLFIKILKEWENYDEIERFNLLQQFEIENARVQNRDARILMIDQESYEIDGLYAHYDIDKPQYIFICDLNDFLPIEYLINITHEGIHAMIDDFFNNKIDIVAFSKVDKNKLFEEYQFCEMVYNVLSYMDMEKVYDIMSYEETFVYDETAMFMLYHIFNSCESIMDCREMFVHVQDVLQLLINKNANAESFKAQGLDYQKLFEEVIKYDTVLSEKNKKEIKTTKEVKDQQDVLLGKILSKLYNAYSDFKNCKKEEKEVCKDKLIDLYFNLAYLYCEEKGFHLLY